MAMQIDPVTLDKQLKEFLNVEMLKVAEPLIQKSLKQVEQKMRTQVAQNLIAYLDHNMDIERFGSDLRILIRHEVRHDK